MKQCKGCLLELDLSAYNVDRSTRDGLRGKCRACARAYNHSRPLPPGGNTPASSRIYYLNNKAYIIANSVNGKKKRKARLKQNGIFKITKKEAQRLYSSNCLYCGISEKIQIDHIIPVARGGRHSIGNLAPACQKCNLSKGTKFLSEWKLKQEKPW